VGLRTLFDPHLDGGQITDVTSEDIVDRITLDNEEHFKKTWWAN